MGVQDDAPVLRVPAPRGLTLEFERSYPYGPDDPYLGGMVMRAISAEVRVGHEVILGGAGDLVDFFQAMYDDFRGWTGERVWMSLEDELRITAWHDGHVHLRWELTNTRYEEQAWNFAVTTRHGAGEDMRQLADAFHQLLT